MEISHFWNIFMGLGGQIANFRTFWEDLSQTTEIPHNSSKSLFNSPEFPQFPSENLSKILLFPKSPGSKPHNSQFPKPFYSSHPINPRFHLQISPKTPYFRKFSNPNSLKIPKFSEFCPPNLKILLLNPWKWQNFRNFEFFWAIFGKFRDFGRFLGFWGKFGNYFQKFRPQKWALKTPYYGVFPNEFTGIFDLKSARKISRFLEAPKFRFDLGWNLRFRAPKIHFRKNLGLFRGFFPLLRPIWAEMTIIRISKPSKIPFFIQILNFFKEKFEN